MAKKVETNKKETPVYRFSIRDLVIIAVLCSLGGVMSTYVKYLANVINIFFGLPYGPGQLVAGLHVFWLVLCYGLVRKLGTGTLAGFLKGVIELFTGNPHGWTVILISGIEGIFIDLGMGAFRKKHAVYSYGISAGLAAAAEVFVFYPIFFYGVSIWLVVATSLIAFGSGVVFGGFFGTGTLELLHESKVSKIPGWRPRSTATNGGQPIKIAKKSQKKVSRLRIKPLYLATIIFIVFFTIAGATYFVTVKPFFNESGITCSISGEVVNPYEYNPKDFTQNQLTIRAELQGQVTFESEKDYTGVPLYTIINYSNPKDSASKIKITASDGYTQIFDLDDVKNDDEIILITENDTLRLIAANYDGEYWVRNVIEIEVT
jgi:energy-coupling factor transport system substrate-specific component